MEHSAMSNRAHALFCQIVLAGSVGPDYYEMYDAHLEQLARFCFRAIEQFEQVDTEERESKQ